MKGNSMTRRLRQIKNVEILTDKLAKFLATKKGNKFVNSLHTDRLDVLCRRFDVSFIMKLYVSHKRVYTWIYSIIKSKGIKIEKEQVIRNTEQDYSKHPQPKIQNFDQTKYIIKPLTRTQLMHGYEVEMTKKWERKHPKPVVNEKEPDLFIQQHIEEWENEHETAIERIRDVIVSRYDKLHLYAKYEKSKDYDVPIATIKDVDGTGHTINEVDASESKVLKKAQKITNKHKDKRPDLIATHIMDHKRQKGRLIIPKAA